MRAGFDIQGLFFLVVVVASVIGQIMKAAKKHNDAAPGSPSAPRPNRPGGGGEPAQELEEFLRNLMGGQAPRREPPPLAAPEPMPTPPDVPRQNKPLLTYRSATATPKRSRRPEKRAYVGVPAVPPPRPAPVRAPVGAAVERGAPGPTAIAAFAQRTRPLAAETNKALAALKAEVHRQVKTPESLRAALLLREILGPPIGLRGM